MNTLFTRTLLWFVATVILTFVAITVTAVLQFDPAERRRGPFGTMMELQMREAQHAYETYGPPGLEATLKRFEQVTETRGVLTDAAGRDLVSGEQHEDLIREWREQRGRSIYGRDRTVIARRTDDQRYIYFLLLNRRNMTRWFLQPEMQITVFGLLVLLSYAFARALTNPVRQLQTAVESFGRGDFRARVRSRRKDEIGRLARTFDEMADRIETLLSAERRLLMDISHELRSPLARLSVAVELARSDADTSRHLDRIQKEIDRLNALVGELLQVTRAEGDPGHIHREAINLTALTASIVDDARLEADSRDCRIQQSTNDEVIITADPELIRRAVENVVRNALRYAPPNSTVEVSVSREQEKAVICVRDQGPGVPEEQLPRIFDAFYRVDSDRARHTGGVGLGLSIARRAIVLHHGTIEARNTNPGFEVRIQLPL